jgi:hypothetical protein
MIVGRIRLSRPMTATAMVVGPFSGGVPGAPSFVGQGGRTAEGEHVVAIASEIPRPHARRVKEEREFMHVQKFMFDFELGTGEKPFDRFERSAGDFPDFLFFDAAGATDAKELECTQLVVSERLGPSTTFQRYRREILNTNSDRFPHLRGLVVFVDFDDFVSFHNDPATRDVAGEPFLAALDQLTPPPPEPPEPPKVLDRSRVIEFAPGTRVWTELLGPTYDSPLFRWAGFELGLNLPFELDAAQVLSRLQERVTSKDKSAPHTVLITGGGMTPGGFTYPSDTALAHLALEGARNKPLSASQIQRVWLHVWENGAIFELTPNQPGYRRVCGRELDLG